MPVGVGINDGLHMKFIEAAYANMLPIGLVPSYIPQEIADLVPFSNLDPADYVEEEIIQEIHKLFADTHDLVNKVSRYKRFFRENYNLPIVLGQVAQQIFK